MADKSIIASLQAQIDSVPCGAATPARRKASTREEVRDNAASGPEDAFKKIVALVNVSDRSEKSVRERLAKAGFSQNDIDEAVERATRCSILDDARFASVLINSRISQGRGSIGIARELSDNGIDPDSVEGWPYDFPFEHDDELNRALDILERKPPRSKNVREGAYRRLVQKGYPSSIAASAARIWSESVNLH